MKVHAGVLMAALCVFVCGCARPSQPLHAQSIVADAPDPAPETYALGATLTAEGAVPKDATVDEFTRGRDVFLSIDVSSAHVDQTIDVKWTGADGQVLHSETRHVPVGAHYAAFASGRGVTATPGARSAIVVINGRRVSEKTFRVL